MSFISSGSFSSPYVRLEWGNPKVLERLQKILSQRNLPLPPHPISCQNFMQRHKNVTWFGWSKVRKEIAPIVIRLFWHPDFNLHTMTGPRRLGLMCQELGHHLVPRDTVARVSLQWLEELLHYWRHTLDESTRQILIQQSSPILPVDEDGSRAKRKRVEEADDGVVVARVAIIQPVPDASLLPPLLPPPPPAARPENDEETKTLLESLIKEKIQEELRKEAEKIQLLREKIVKEEEQIKLSQEKRAKLERALKSQNVVVIE
jgi:hypothetical protein